MIVSGVLYYIDWLAFLRCGQLIINFKDHALRRNFWWIILLAKNEWVMKLDLLLWTVIFKVGNLKLRVTVCEETGLKDLFENKFCNIWIPELVTLLKGLTVRGLFPASNLSIFLKLTTPKTKIRSKLNPIIIVKAIGHWSYKRMSEKSFIVLVFCIVLRGLQNTVLLLALSVTSLLMQQS